MAKRKDRIERFYESQRSEWYRTCDAIYGARYNPKWLKADVKYRQFILRLCMDFDFAYQKVMGFRDSEEEVRDTLIKNLGEYEKKKYSLIELLGGTMEKRKIEWMRVPVNTKLQIKSTGDSRWKNRYFALCKDGIPYVFCGGTDSWSAENGWDSIFPITEFTECRFADEEMEKEYWKD